MPVLFDDLTEGDRSRTVVWLRFVEEEDSRGVQAALFETSAHGEPLAFYFTRMDLNDPHVKHRGDVRQAAVSSLAKTLFQTAARSQMLILGLADEIPPGTFNGDIRVRSPFCFIRPAETPTYADFENGGPANP